MFVSVFPPSSSWRWGQRRYRWLVDTFISIEWQAMGRGVMDLCWTCLEICLELPKSPYLISHVAIWWINSKVPEGSMITSENNSVTRESSFIKITLELNRSFCLHERGSWHFSSSDPCTQRLMTSDVLARSRTLRPPQFNDGVSP